MKSLASAWVGRCAGAMLAAAAVTTGAHAQSGPNTLGPDPVPATDSISPELSAQIRQGAIDLYHKATDPTPVTVAGYKLNFEPMHFSADPFAQGIGHLQTDVWLAHFDATNMRFYGNWKVETGFEGGVQLRHTFGGTPKNHDYVLEPNFYGVRAEFYQRATYPLDAQARADDDASRKAGYHVAPQASSSDRTWLMRALTGGTHLFGQTMEGTEFHFDRDPVRPYVRVMAGVERDIPFGNSNGIVLRMGPELRATTRGAHVEPYIEADYLIHF